MKAAGLLRPGSLASKPRPRCLPAQPHLVATLPPWRDCFLIVAAALVAACAAVPSQYVKQAEPGVTLTKLANRPEAYRGKVVILGGVVVSHKEQGDRIWLYMKNRPLDDDYVPHLPATLLPSESGHYWVAVALKNLPKTYRAWAQVTVVGRVADATVAPAPGAGKEPVLDALYLRGWGANQEPSVWEQRLDPNYIVERPPATREN